MSDIFREVEEEVRRDRLDRIWKEYGDYIVAAASLLIVAAAGYRLWLYYDARERAKASNEYAVAEQLVQGGQSQAAAEAFAHLAQTAPSGYAKLSQLQEAGALLAAGNKADAIALYKKLMGDSDDILAAVARIRLAWATVEGSSRADIQALLAPVSGTGSPWNAPAGEILAYADYRVGAIKEAVAQYKRLAADSKAAANIRQRSQAMATFLEAGGDRDVGTVVMPASPSPAIAPGGGPQGAAPGGAAKPAAPARPAPVPQTSTSQGHK